MNRLDERHPQADPTVKDSVACGAVLATMILTIACGAFVVDAGPDAPVRPAQVVADSGHE